MPEAGLLFCAAVWGATFYLVKDALSGVHPVAMVAYRFLAAAACALPWVLRRRSLSPLLRESAVLASLLAVLYAAQTAGLQFTTASNSGFITGLFVVFVPLFLLTVLGTPPHPLQWAAVIIAVAGLWLLTGGARQFNRGDALTILSAMTYAAHLLATDRVVRREADPVLLAFHQFWMTGAACLLWCAAAGWPLRITTPQAAWTTLFLAVLPTFACFYIQMLAQKVVAPLKTSLIFSSEPVFAALFAWTLGGEEFFPARGFGGFLIVAAMVIGEIPRTGLLKARRKQVLPV